MENLLRDLRLALRQLAKRPWITAAAVLSLGLGIGGNTTIFTLIQAVFLDPFPVAETERVVSVFTLDENNTQGPFGAQLPVSHPNFEDFREQSHAFSHLVAYQTVPVSLVLNRDPREVQAQAVSAGYFDMLGVEPDRGRLFRDEEETTEGAYPVVVLSHGFWQQQLGGDPDVVGRVLTLNGFGHEVVGVAPAGFVGSNLILTPDLWVPMALHDQLFSGPFAEYFDTRRALLFLVMGKLAPGVTLEQAEAELETIARRLEEAYPDANGGRTVTLMPLAQTNLPPALREVFRMAVGLLMAVVGLVLLIACANVANLLLVRALGRQDEMAIRLSLGARRRRLVAQLLTEGVLLALTGGAVGLLVAAWARDALWSLRPPFLGSAEPDLSLDPTVLAFTFGLSLATGVLFGLVPALTASRADLTTALKGRVGEPGGWRIWSPRNLLVIGQVALCMVALVGSGLFLRSLRQAERVDPGFDAERLGVLTFNLGTQGYGEARGKELHRRVLQAAGSLPGVTSAALATNLPLQGLGNLQRTVIPEGQDTRSQEAGTLVTVDSVAPEYFDTLGIPVLSGRGFHDLDLEESLPVAIVNQTMAEQFWPGESPLGKRFTFYGQEQVRQVVGVARDSVYNNVGEEPMPYVYLPLRQSYADQVWLFVRAAGDPGPALGAARREVQRLDPELPLTDVATYDEVIARSLWASRLGALLLGIFGLLALVLAAVGIYGVTSFAVAQKDRELGIRIAIGAQRRRILGLVVGQGMTLVILGVALGLLVAGLVSGSLSSLLFGVRPLDPATFTTTALLLTAIALLANLLPAYRATRIDPVAVLNSE